MSEPESEEPEWDGYDGACYYGNCAWYNCQCAQMFDEESEREDEKVDPCESSS